MSSLPDQSLSATISKKKSLLAGDTQYESNSASKKILSVCREEAEKVQRLYVHNLSIYYRKV